MSEKTRKLDIRNYEELRDASQEMGQLVKNAQIPSDLEGAILAAYANLCQEAGEEKLKVSVRSSEVHEDIMASFAGQYETALNVPPDDLLAQYKNVLASQFTPRALFYYKDKEFRIGEMAMAVGVLAMIPARASGIIYSRDPGNPEDDTVLVNAIWGLGSYAVGGMVPTSNYRVSGENVEKITNVETGRQEVMLSVRPESGTKEVPVPKECLSEACLTNEQISQLASYARKVEAHFGQPQDLEWAMDQDGQLYFLQSRPLRLTSTKIPPDERRRTAVKDHEIFLDKGTIASRGVGAGRVHVVEREEDLKDFPEGGVLVLRHSHPEFAVVLQRASAVVSDIGNVMGHLATVAREYNVPALF
ncbi:MAG: pyruvate, phosphate dikinase, partial [Desulfobacterales bacterium]|nr:pyruvate, phosphate dikinase [Desulfobacterales bacterium]